MFSNIFKLLQVLNDSQKLTHVIFYCCQNKWSQIQHLKQQQCSIDVSRSHKSDKGFPGLKSRKSWAAFLFGSSKGDSISLPIQLLEAACLPDSWPPFPTFKASKGKLSPLPGVASLSPPPQLLLYTQWVLLIT